MNLPRDPDVDPRLRNRPITVGLLVVILLFTLVASFVEIRSKWI